MKTRVFKAASVLLTISLLIISLSFIASAADNEFSEKWQLFTATPTVVMDGTNPKTVEIQMIVKEELTCYALAGKWDIADETGKVALTNVVFNPTLPVDPAGVEDFAYGPVAGGEMQWLNTELTTQVTLPAGYAFMTATYTVAADATSGTYAIGFHKAVYAGEDAEPNEVEETLEILITVESHTCVHKMYGHDETNHWSICECGETVWNTTFKHDFTNGDCICGAKAPVTNISVVAKGAINYTVEGSIVTVTHTAACKVGYWDATAGKYVAIPAVANGSSYNFTAPAGVTEVLLVVKGDVTGEGVVNLGDRLRLAKGMLPANNANRDPITEAWQIFVADVTGEGVVNLGDRLRLAKSMLPANNANRQAFEW